MSAQTLTYDPRGGARELLMTRDRECLLEGPANTGKSYAGLWKAHLAALKYPGMHAILLRKTLVSLKSSTLVTYRERILGPNTPVRYWSARGDESAHYAYPAVNGQVSKLYVGGMDKADKIMSTEYDLALWDEATDGAVSEWEALQTRLRYGRMPYQQAIACVNPQAPTHWLNQRANVGQIHRLLSRHEDNPTVTPDYLAMLNALTGVRRTRLYLGLWAAAEGTVYEDSWDATRNLVDRFAIPPEWPRYLTVDFGYTHPFVCQWWAEDPDGRFYRYREIYLTHRLVEDHAKQIKALSRWGLRDGEPLPQLIICDHDAEDRATLERYLGLVTTPAYKSVADGIQAVAARWRPAGDGKPRLMLLRDSLVERDPWLADAKQPTCTEEEIDSYIWALGAASAKRDTPVKEHDHGCFVAGTMIETITGPQAIETIAPGALVLTRQGYKRVLASGMTQPSAEVMTLHVSDGRTLTGTPDHPVYHNRQKYSELRALRYGDTIELADSYLERLTLWRRKASQRSSSTTELSSVVIRSRSTLRHATIIARMAHTSNVAFSTYTAKSGKRRMGRYRRVARYTMLTATHSTTQWKTFNALQQTNTRQFTDSGKRLRDATLCVGASRYAMPKRLRASGMAPKMGVRGTKNLATWRGKQPSTRTTPVSSVASRFSLAPCNQVTRNTVPTLVKQPRAWRPVWTMSSEPVRTVARRSRPTNTPLSATAHAVALTERVYHGNSANVSSVAQPLRRYQAQPSGSVLPHVRMLTYESSKQPVYNLTVDEAHEFFANGILVHNCDAARYLVATRDVLRGDVSYVEWPQ